MTRRKDDAKPQKPPTMSPQRQAALAKALRDNLRRRKAPGPARPKEEPDG